MTKDALAVGKPVLITENGLADGTDRMRGDFLRTHTEAIRSLPVHGYFHWSLLDNFEWLDGYGPKFGLYEVNRSTMERRARPSAAVFRELGRDFLAN